MKEETPLASELQQRLEAAKAKEKTERTEDSQSPKSESSPSSPPSIVTHDETAKEPVAQTVKTEPLPFPSYRPSKKGWSIFFLVLALNFGIGGCNVAYRNADVVGGAAYNYIIGSGRGTAIVGLGIVCGLVSLILAVYNLTNVIVYYNKK